MDRKTRLKFKDINNILDAGEVRVEKMGIKSGLKNTPPSIYLVRAKLNRSKIQYFSNFFNFPFIILIYN